MRYSGFVEEIVMGAFYLPPKADPVCASNYLFNKVAGKHTGSAFGLYMSQGSWQSRLRWRRRSHKAHQPQENTGGYVYVVYLGYDDVYKIGRSRSINGRLSSLSAANPRIRPVILQRVRNLVKAERHLHGRFGSKRIERECYHLDANDLASIVAYLDTVSPAVPDADTPERV